jgi:hypothetical protein
MNEKKPVLLIEQLSVFTIAVAYFTAHRYQKIFFVHQSNFITRVRNRSKRINTSLACLFTRLDNIDFLGLFYDYMEEACEYSHDRIYERNRDNLYCRVALQFCGDEDYSIVLKKELLNRYVASRVKTFLILQKISEPFKEIYFIPQDNEEIASTFSRPFNPEEICYTGRFVRGVNTIRQGLLNSIFLLAFPVLLLGVLVKISLKGLSRSNPVRKCFRYGIDMQKNGLIGERGLDTVTRKFFLHNDDDFAPDKILHVVRLGHRLEEGGRKMFEELHCPYVELDRLKIPLRYFYQRMLGGYIAGSLYRSLKFFLAGSNRKTIFILPALAAMKMVMEEEIVNLHYSVKVFISNDDYSPYHIVRTIVAHKSGNHTVGFQWADYYNHNSTFSHMVYDRYAIWGEFYQGFHKRALSHSTPVIIGAGIYGSDTMYELQKSGYYPEKYREIKKKNLIIGIMGSAFEPETSVTQGPATRFHQDVIELTDKYPNVFRILKPKTTWMDKDLDELMKTRPNLVMERELTTPRFLLVPDLIIVMSNSSVGMEALMAGKKVVYYSFVTPLPHQKIASHSKYMVAFSRDELQKILDGIITDGIYDDAATIDGIRSWFGYKFDGKVTERLRQTCRALVSDDPFNLVKKD